MMLELPLTAKNFKLKTKHYNSFCEKFEELENDLSNLYKVVENSFYKVGNCLIYEYFSPKDVINYINTYYDGVSVDEFDLDETFFKDIELNGLSVMSKASTNYLNKRFGLEGLFTNCLINAEEVFGKPKFVLMQDYFFNSGIKKSLFFTKDNNNYYSYLKPFRGHYSLKKNYLNLLNDLGFKDFEEDTSGIKIVSEPKRLSPVDISESLSKISGKGLIKKPATLELYYPNTRMHLAMNAFNTQISINVEKKNDSVMEAVRILNNFFCNDLEDYVSIFAKVSKKI